MSLHSRVEADFDVKNRWRSLLHPRDKIADGPSKIVPGAQRQARQGMERIYQIPLGTLILSKCWSADRGGPRCDLD
jgi:hypothetical protein